MQYIFIYLVSILAANLIITEFGPSMSIVTAFVLIGLDLTVRDSLHDAWKNSGLWWKMILLIGTGSALSYLLNRNAGPIALASFIAFGASGIADTITYHFLGHRTKLLRINGSNVVSSAVDSVVFPALAFGFPLMWLIMLGQFAAKVFGGGLWSIVLNWKLFQKARGKMVKKTTIGEDNDDLT
jgi:queuosine precursor transporter